MPVRDSLARPFPRHRKRTVATGLVKKLTRRSVTSDEGKVVFAGAPQAVQSPRMVMASRRRVTAGPLALCRSSTQLGRVGSWRRR